MSSLYQTKRINVEINFEIQIYQRCACWIYIGTILVKKDTTRTLFQNLFDFYTVKWTMINMSIAFKNWACKQENIFCSRLNLGQDFWEKIILKSFYVSRINEEKHCKKIWGGGGIQNSEFRSILTFWISEAY